MKKQAVILMNSIAILMCVIHIAPASEPTAESPPTQAEIIKALELVPMDDDEACIGYYKEMYACDIRADHDKKRPAASLIYYLMPGGMFDPWHKLASDEILVYHAGAPMQQLLIYPDGTFKEYILGPDPTKGQQPQIIIPAETWMGFRIMAEDPDAWGLYGVFCAPGWHIEDIAMSTGQQLGEQFPQAIDAMKRLDMYQ